MAAAKKKKATNSTKKTKKAPAKAAARGGSSFGRQGGAIALFALGILIFFITLIPGEAGWLVLHNIFFGLFSYTAYAVAPLLIYIAVMLTMDKPVGASGGKAALCGLLLLESCGLVQLFTNNSLTASGFSALKEIYEGSVNFTYGGVFSLPLGHWLVLLLGRTGAVITNCVLVFVTLLFLTGLTLRDCLKLVTKPAKKISAAYQNQLDENESRHKARFNVDVNIDDLPAPKKRGRKTVTEESLSPETEPAAEKTVPLPMPEVPPAAAPTPPLKELVKAFDPAAKENEQPEEKPAGAQGTQKEEEEAAKALSIAAEGQETTPPAYRFPPLSLLSKPAAGNSTDIRRELTENGGHLVEVLNSFGVSTKIINISRGPAVTRYELQPSSGVKISRITNLADDIALNLAASGVRIEAPIPGKAAVGIEVPNKTRSSVSLSEILGSREFKTAKSKLTVALGRDIAGNVKLANIADMPHILIAGATGSGKSVCINTFIMSLLYKATPEEVRLLLIDPKVVELGVYNGTPHLLVPVVTDARKASGALTWAVTEMMNRYKLFAETDTRNLKSYNELAEKEEGRTPLPQIVIIIDELADLMMVAPGEVEDAICRLAQMARAAGMHLIIATQRPSVDVITGLIKANIPSRLSFAVSSQIDSRTILDGGGAEKLLGRGDMLFKPMGENKSLRIQGCYVSDSEIEEVIHFLTATEQATYDDHIAEEIDRLKATEKGSKKSADAATELPADSDADETFYKAIEVVVEAGLASTSLLQRRLKLGYARAARYVDMMEQRGIVGPFEGSKPRKVLISKEQFMEMTLNNTAPAPPVEEEI